MRNLSQQLSFVLRSLRSCESDPAKGRLERPCVPPSDRLRKALFCFSDFFVGGSHVPSGAAHPQVRLYGGNVVGHSFLNVRWRMSEVDRSKIGGEFFRLGRAAAGNQDGSLGLKVLLPHAVIIFGDWLRLDQHQRHEHQHHTECNEGLGMSVHIHDKRMKIALVFADKEKWPREGLKDEGKGLRAECADEPHPLIPSPSDGKGKIF